MLKDPVEMLKDPVEMLKDPVERAFDNPYFQISRALSS